ncbi:hypothetical protein AB9K26_13195 [Psychroserpens sp. XS_ASV72]|uniref:hypothetical protein n=1 Tax=Psychroserpens sp. XS_ASV72 TaxID=3241293 RepID=UPI003517D97C
MKTIATTLLLFLSFYAYAQVGVGTTNPDATLDIEASNVANPASNDGILIPRIDNFPSVNPTANQDGMMVFVTGNGTPTKGFYYWDHGSLSWLAVSGAKNINDLLDGRSDTNGSSVFLGVGSGINDDQTDNYNVGVGSNALRNNLSGYYNVALGFQSLYFNSTGLLNTAVGTQALLDNLGDFNSGFGTYSLSNNSTGDNNTALGYSSLTGITDGNSNISIGSDSGFGVNGNSSNNIFIGRLSGYSLSPRSVSGSIWIGYTAGANETKNNTLYIENSAANEDNALIYGEFNTNILRTNSEFQIGNPSLTGYAFPTSDGTAGQVLTTDGAGNISFQNSSQDADWYEAGTTNSPTNNSDNIFTEGYVGIGDPTPDARLDIEYSGTDSAGTMLDYEFTAASGIGRGLYITTDHTGASELYGSQIDMGNSGASTRVAGMLINNLGGANAGEHIGIVSEVTGIGANYGYQSIMSGFGTNFGFQTTIDNNANQNYGFDAYITANSNASSNYGVRSRLTGGRYNYAIHGAASGGSLGNYAGFFGDSSISGSGNVYIQDNLEVDGSFTFTDGNEALGQVLASDALGNASWINPNSVFTDTQNTLDQAYDEGGAGAGRVIEATHGALRINGTDGFLVTGTFGSGNTINSEITGAGTRMFFNPLKSALRAGTVTGNEWNNTNIGNYSTAFGYNTIASSIYSFALGDGTTASGTGSIATGLNSTASGAYATTFGYLTISNGSYSTTFGERSTASGIRSFAMGFDTTASGDNSNVSGIGNIAPSFAEMTIGSYSRIYTPSSSNSFNPNDRIFSIGNGMNAAGRSNALTIFKNGTMNINDAYNMPTTDGSVGQVMTTDGSGNLTFQDIVGDGDTQNTLDQAYDEGGSGSGRIVTVDSGPIEFTGTSGTSYTQVLSNDDAGDILNIISTGIVPEYTSTIAIELENDITTNNNNGNNYGIFNKMAVNGTRSNANHIGFRNWFLPAGSTNSQMYGFYNNSQNGGTGDHYGFYNRFSTDAGSGTMYGFYNSINSAHNNTKYGLYSAVVGALGTNYAVYAEASDNANSWAGYFIGRMSLGNSTSTGRYLMPLSDGTSGQVMTTDGAGNVTFQNPTINTDDQQIDTIGLAGTVLGISLEDDGVAPITVDLASINTDDQRIQNFNFNASTNILTLEMEDDGQAPQTVDLSSLNPSRSLARITMSADQSFTASTWQKLNFDTVDFDLNSEFNTVTDEFEVTTTGYYRINASWRSTLTSTSVDAFGIAIVVNGVFEGAVNFNNSGSGYVFRSINRILDLNAGDSIEIQILNTGPIDVFSNDIVTSFEIEQIR